MSYDTALDEFLGRFGDLNSTEPVSTLKPMGHTKLATAEIKTAGKLGKQHLKPLIGGDETSLMDKAAGLLGGLSGGMGQGAYAARYDADPEMQSNYMAMEGVKNTIAPMLGPIGMGARAFETASKEIGTAAGGEKGGDIVGGFVDPLSAQMEVLGNKDATAAEKVFGTIAPFLGLAGNARNRTKDRLQTEENKRESYFEQKEREGTYRQEQGLASLDNLKALRKKQLGLS